MRKYLVFAAFMIFAFAVSAQKIKVNEDNEKIGGANNPVLTVIINGADQTTVEKAWKNLMKDYGAKVTYKSEIFAQDATFKDMSSKTVDVYAVAEIEKDGSVKLTAAFDLGGAFVSSANDANKYKVAEKIVRDFAVDVSKTAVADKLSDEKKKQKGYEKDLSDLQKRKEKLEKEIEDYKNRIAENEKEIESNKTDQEKTSKQIDDQKTVVSDIQKNLDDIK
jgi:vacuolar-type H+-ATPase subunit I/STV1